jgi:magnesium transporter
LARTRWALIHCSIQDPNRSFMMGSFFVLQTYVARKGKLEPVVGDAVALGKAFWIDVHEPTPEEQRALEQALSIRLRVPEEPAGFRVSTPLRSVDNYLILTALLLAGLDEHRPQLVTVQFIKSQGPLVTVSKGGPGGLAWLAKECEDCISPQAGEAFPVFLDMIVEHATDMLDRIGGDLDRVNRALFQHHAARKHRLQFQSSPRRRNRQLERILIELGYCQEVLVKLRRSILSFRRTIILLRTRETAREAKEKLEWFERELQSLAETEQDLSATAAFMLDGAVGFIGILQSRTINIMTIVGVLLTPPVLVASVYGMNFQQIPELSWSWGYPWALALMVVSALGMYVIVRLRGWF